MLVHPQVPKHELLPLLLMTVVLSALLLIHSLGELLPAGEVDPGGQGTQVASDVAPETIEYVLFRQGTQDSNSVAQSATKPGRLTEKSEVSLICKYPVDDI
jgi:hypothetical protein